MYNKGIQSENVMELDIHSSMPGDAGILSNLYMKPFLMEGVFYGSLEGFLQSLRYQYECESVKIAMMCGVEAKMAGKARQIKNDTLYYMGEPFNRHSAWYKKLLERAFTSCFAQNESFQRAIYNTREMKLIHSIGKDDPSETILTNSEFIGLLERLRPASEFIFKKSPLL